MSARGAAVAAALACAIGVGSAAPGPRTSPVTLLADVSDEIRAAIAALDEQSGTPAEGVALLAEIARAAPAYHFDCGLVEVDTDRRWFATMPPADPAAPILELRRWPGDTVLAFFELEGAPSKDVPPALPGARLEPSDSGDPDVLRWDGVLTTGLGVRPIVWIERKAPGVARRLGALLVPGDAGLGEAAVPDLVLEMLVVVARAKLRANAWEQVEGVLPDVPLALPTLDAPPGPADEARETWQVAEGSGFTIGLPPGIRARRLDQGVPAPRAVPFAALWLRGRFIDRTGAPVAIGDGIRAGYLARIGSADKRWLEGGKPPLGAPSATRIAGDDYSLACDQSGALAARAERWSEPGFSGEWLVFRLYFAAQGVEIGLPVLEGRRSEALFWIPVTWRGAGEAPAPPPVDPAERFGIAFDPFTRLEKKRRPWSEGRLTLPGLRLELPSGWFPITTLRSEHGFPVSLVNAKGRPLGRIERLTADASELADPASFGWKPAGRVSARKPVEVFVRADEARLYRMAAGHAVVVTPAPGTGTAAAWERLIESASLLRSAGTKSGAGSKE